MRLGDAAAAPLAAPPAEAQARTRAMLLLLAAIAVIWMATRPYGGVVHDARLYALQALGAADPARFADDLFLRFGSQDRFTVFSRVYAPVLGWAGVSLGALLLTLLGQAAWLSGAYRLAVALLGDRARALAAVAGLVALPNAYGAGFTFGYGEAFLTPRLFAEALAMLALGGAVRGSTAGAAAALAAAGAFHPVMAAPGAAAFLVFKARGEGGGRRLPWAAAAACAGAAAVGLAASGVEPFARLGVRLDPLWFAVARHRVAGVFMGGWSQLDWGVAAGHAALAALALVVLPGAGLRRLLVAVLLTAAAGLSLTAIGADLARNHFVTGLQPWRAAWPLAVTAHLLAVPLLLEFAGGTGAARPDARALFCGGLALLFLARLLPGAHLLAASLLVLAAVLARRRAGNTGSSDPVLSRALAAGVAVLIGVTAVRLGFGMKGAMEAWPEEFRARLCAFALCAGGLGLVAATAADRRPAAAPAAAAAFLLFCAALGWDQRTAWTKFVESPDPPPGDLAAFLPDDAPVYWDGGLELLWFRLGRPSHHSCVQGAGVIFFRETAIAFQHRNESFRFEPPISERCGPWRDAGPPPPPPTAAELRRACAREPGLGRIVLPHPVEGAAPRREWAAPVRNKIALTVGGELRVREAERFYAYACDDLR